jgi:phosphoglycolate phosphatase-like HAD superfamily hydrolase
MKLLLFDIDGTLVWTRGAGRAAMQQALVTLFHDDDTLRERLRTRVETHVFGGKTDWLTLTELLGQDGFTGNAVREIVPRFNEAMGISIEAMITAFDVQPCTGARALIDTLKQHDQVRLGLVTGNVSSSAPVKLAAAGFDPRDFPVGAYGNDALERDDLPLLALHRANDYYQRDFTPHDTIIIGDTLADIQCARACGMRVAAVCTGYGKRAELADARPDWLLDDLTGFAGRVV